MYYTLLSNSVSTKWPFRETASELRGTCKKIRAFAQMSYEPSFYADSSRSNSKNKHLNSQA